MSYGLWVCAGIVAAFLAARIAEAEHPDLSADQHRALLLAAMIGAVLGAYVLEIPADLRGWAWIPPGTPVDALPLGGRTVLGGLIGGWALVEVVKRRVGIHAPTGDRFALPLAIALGFGRLGCAAAGCCAGRPSSAWWAWHGRYPVQLIEAGFHGLAAIALAIAAARGAATGRRLAIYLSCYAVARFLLEFWRLNPPILAGMTWYQLLSLVLLAIAGSAWISRRGGVAPSPAPTGN